MNGMAQVLRRSLLTLVLAGVFLLPVSAGASLWCGDNGVIRFSFVEGDSLVTVLNVPEPENGVSFFDVYAWLTDIDPVAQDGEAFINVGGVEMKLDITADEVFILEQDFPTEALNLGKELGHVAAGFHPEQRIRDGQVLLVRWKIMIQGKPENVRFGLDPSGLMSCRDLRGCRKSEPPALYVGGESSRQSGVIIGAGYVPSWINPTGEPDQTPVTGKQSWRDVGVFQAR
jgi:hypothetical protein